MFDPAASDPSAADALVEALLSTPDAVARLNLVRNASLQAAAAHSAVMRLINEAERFLGLDPRRMESVCMDALLIAEGAADPFLQAMVNLRYADAFRFTQRNREAVVCLDAAQRTFLQLGRPVEAARTRIGWVWAMHALGRSQDALAAAGDARKVLVAAGEKVRAANLDLSVCFVCTETSRLRQALRHYRHAHALYEEIGGDQGSEGIARCHYGRGGVLVKLGRHREAQAELQEARAIYEKLGDSLDGARNLRAIGDHELALGHYARAVRTFQEARRMYQATGSRAGAVMASNALAESFLRLGRPADALAELSGVDEGLRSIEMPQYAFVVANTRVAAHLMLGENATALALIEEAQQAYPDASPGSRAWLAAHRAEAFLNDGSPEDGLEAARTAGSLARRAGLRALAADALVKQAHAHLRLGRQDEAARSARSAHRLAREVDVPPILFRASEARGLLAEAQGRPWLARKYYANAIEELEREQRGVIFEFRDTFAAGRNRAYERLAGLQLAAGQPRQALLTVERAKSRALADAVSGSVELRPRGSAAVRRLTRDLAAAREEYAAALSRRDSGTGLDALRDGAAVPGPDLAQLEQRVAGLIRSLQTEAAADGFADAYSSSVLTDLRPLDAGTSLVEFFVSGREIIRFQVTGGDVKGEVLPVTLTDVERLIRSLRLNLSAAEQPSADLARLSEQARLVLGRLYTLLLDGLEDLDGLTSLVVVPHGMLHYLPFHALYDGERFLAERVAVSYAPSATLYELCRNRPRSRSQQALVLGCSAHGRLPFTLSEAQAVGEALAAPVFLEEAATRSVIRSLGSRAGLLHIAAHGSFRADAPLFSSIELADGPLTTADIYSLDLKSSLVCLSACETGRSVVGGGDELVGMVRAFLYAGAACLLVSQWRVDDAATADLMLSFYRQLQQGHGAARALQAAQVACIQQGGPGSGRDHPLFWAGFQVVGDDRVAPSAAGRPRRQG